MKHMTMAQVRERLELIAAGLDSEGKGEYAASIRGCVAQMFKRPPRHRTTRRSQRMTPQLREEIRAFAVLNPHMSNQEMGDMFRVNTGRISETLSGYRDGR